MVNTGAPLGQVAKAGAQFSSALGYKPPRPCEWDDHRCHGTPFTAA
jgi:hypothetical protein